jgi:hypothetical protein
MRWNSRFANRTFASLCLLAAASAFPATPAAPEASAPATSTPAAAAESPQAPAELSFMKGDTREGSKVQIRIVGDSLYYRQTTYAPDAAPVRTDKAALLSGHRRRALKSVLGELPRYPTFGTCFGKGMRYYMVETAEGRFYRSLPERSGKCYVDEPGIWSLFQDLDDLMTPPSNPDYQEYSAS